MKTMLITLTSAILLMSNIASAQQPPEGAQGQEAPTAKMTGQDMMGHMGRGMMGERRRGMHPGMHMRLMMILIDSDGDGALSLEEVQGAHAKIFKAVDTDKDGKVTFEEMETFFRGGPSTADR